MSDRDDWVPGFLAGFAAMSEAERDAAIDALPPEEREALVTLADARTAASAVDLLEVLDAGHAGLDRLFEVTHPTDLFTVINLAAGERPHLVVEALFAAVVLRRGWDRGEPSAMVALREQWHWHVHERLEQDAAAAAEDRTPPGSVPGA